MRSWLTRFVRTIRGDELSRPRRTAVLPVVVLATAIAYFAAHFAGLLEPGQSVMLTALQAGLVAGQSIALVVRVSAPMPVFAVVVLFQSALLATSGAELGIGSLAVMIAVFHLIRRADRPLAFQVLAAAAVVSSTVVFLAAVVNESLAPLAVVALVAGRLLVEYLAPTLIAEFARNRAQLVDATRDRKELIDRERVRLLEQERLAERTALARELHDIAGHHLSGIIVSAQAAGALMASDPERSRSMLRELEQEARATMVDLRSTVGLLRPDAERGEEGKRTSGGTPTLSDLTSLVEAAERRGQPVTFAEIGQPVRLGPIAEATIFRMVQESLANAARHAPEAACSVSIEYPEDEVVVLVENEPSHALRGRTPANETRDRRGYGLIGMHERAELIGADLATGPTVSGGWRNSLRIARTTLGARR